AFSLDHDFPSGTAMLGQTERKQAAAGQPETLLSDAEPESAEADDGDNGTEAATAGHSTGNAGGSDAGEGDDQRSAVAGGGSDEGDMADQDLLGILNLNVSRCVLDVWWRWFPSLTWLAGTRLTLLRRACWARADSARSLRR